MSIIVFFHYTNTITFNSVINVLVKKFKWVDLDTVIDNPSDNVFTIMFDDGLKMNQPILHECWNKQLPAYVPIIGRIFDYVLPNVENLVKLHQNYATLLLQARNHLLALNGDVTAFLDISDIPKEYILNHMYSHMRLPIIKNLDYNKLSLFDWQEWYPDKLRWYNETINIFAHNVPTWIDKDLSFNKVFMSHNLDKVVIPFNKFDKELYAKQNVVSTIIADKVYKVINNELIDLDITRIDLTDGHLENLFKYPLVWGN